LPDKLAIHGGEAVIAQGAVRPWPYVTDEDRAAVAEVMRDGDMGAQREIQEIWGQVIYLKARNE